MMEGFIFWYVLDLIFLDWGTGDWGHWSFGVGYGGMGKRGIAENILKTTSAYTSLHELHGTRRAQKGVH